MMFGVNRGSDKTWKQIPRGSCGAELGVWKGDTSAKFLKRAGHIHLVDSWAAAPYKNSTEHDGYQAYLDRYAKLTGGANEKDFADYYEKIYQGVVERFAKKPVTIHRKTTAEFFADFTEKLDWVYVDADHSFEGCLFDLKNAMRIIKPGGLLLGDDFYPSKPGVMRAVVEFSIETGLVIDNFYQTQFKFVIKK